jgi:4a-hydroxytetrahydrobiopterin dehydratase
METPTGWAEIDGALEREFEFANFAQALAFVNRVGAAAEEADHHPDIEIHWNRVKLRWWTHVTGTITARDRELAVRTNELVDG